MRDKALDIVIDIMLVSGVAAMAVTLAAVAVSFVATVGRLALSLMGAV